ncbi:acyl-CoA thioester hydrolase/BAAT C-terminal domain-containing protein [Gilvimarinus sp. SDUM040013]|uniref:Acyl-CoA thioester hydrolase/BAAT C-terminal domain-containing protein n=1 Tax=Gilvimarinus gilvus TaxID=3058038 RepID=A0ABU4S0U2_9GAMM|nr:acyl-CoA thioester hydrolase/BAAT C-terminal domain-containing protein [Gilvimarinus sp. SDUM040013]MDO3386655.1 acyl-CoA thioester hydrolase/BAAT C-terminal domain-containing protein [Gilvimarinus sp. SDUM040013]MDX6849458.1 acyl-CoA thioester hydrolase/BAAT C-terminal domain-containing protein [Gilvimarinus sp. SDUM040013]
MQSKKLKLALFLVFYLFAATTTYGKVLLDTDGAGFKATYFASENSNRYGVIVLGGSSGGKPNKEAIQIRKMGYSVLSLSYFDRSGENEFPETLELIPVEYFDKAKNWLLSREETKDSGVILIGLSKGAELSLLLGSLDDTYKAIVAIAPSHVVWQGIPKNFSNLTSAPSSWSQSGEGVPFLPYVSNEEKKRLGFENRHKASLTNEAAVTRAKIDVHAIEADVLLISGDKDKVWPASEMAQKVCSEINSFESSGCAHIRYKDGDHLLSGHQKEVFSEINRFLKKQENGSHPSP